MTEEINLENKELTLKERVENIEKFLIEVQRAINADEVRFKKHDHKDNRVVFYEE